MPETLDMTGRLAIDGGAPIRDRLLPYGRQSIDQSDIAAVVAALQSDYLTTGPRVAQFEDSFAEKVNAGFAVAVNSGTAALHCVYHALELGPGDEVLVPAITFASTANALLSTGARPIFVDVEPETLLIDPTKIEARITPRTRALVAVDYAGQPCGYDALTEIADRHGLTLVSDACHALGAAYGREPVGSVTALTAFSFHPVKAITTGEGGMVTTSDRRLADRMRAFRSHCITMDHHARSAQQSWEYDIHEVGCNYRLSDVQCALGVSQLQRLEDFIFRRRAIARRYGDALAEMAGVEALAVRPEVEHAYHLYVVRLDLSRLRADRGAVFRALRAEGIGVNVHYRPVHLHELYRTRFGTKPGDCPAAESAYGRILSLPIFPAMTDRDVDDVVAALGKVLGHYAG